MSLAHRVPAPLRFTAALAAWAAAALAGGLVLAAGAPAALGQRPMTVMSGSMQPAIHTGDVVVAEPIHPLEARIGDVVTFRAPDGSGRLITHRVRAMRARDGRVEFTTRGDANNAGERWSVAVAGEIGRVSLRVPKLGYAVAWIGTRDGRLLALIVPALLLGGLELRRIWRA